MTLELTVRVKEDVKLDTIILNSVTINTNETPPTTKRCEVITGHSALHLTKGVLGAPEGQIASVSADGPIMYTIQLVNNNDFSVTDVSIFDSLPKEVSFIYANGGAASGTYDPNTHSYTWLLSPLGPGKSVYLELNARVNQDVAKGTIFTNYATVESKEAPSSTAIAEAIVGDSPSIIHDMQIRPEIIRRSGPTYNVQAIIIFPVGYGKEDIADVLPILYPGPIAAKEQFVYGSSTRAKVIGLFDKNELLEAVPGNGQVTLKMVGTLASGRTYTGEATVYITSFSGS
jgi:uncharacterized repeat protein (TIGR01451 family)